MLVDIAYPAPLIHVPKGARNERMGFAEMRVSARLREARRADLVEVGRFRSSSTADQEALYALDGALWRAAPAGGGGPGSAAALAEYLSGEGRRRHFTIRDHLARTPLGFAPLRAGPQEPSDPERSREIRFDGRPGAEARVLDFVASDILIADGGAFMRSRPVLTSGDSRRALPMTQSVQIAPGRWRTAGLRTEGHPYACHPFQYFVACPDDVDGHWEYLISHHIGTSPRFTKGAPPFHGLPRGVHGDGNVLLMANTLPELLLRDVAHALEMSEFRDPADSPRLLGLRRAKAEMGVLSALGNVGGVGLHDAPGVIDRVLGHARLAGETVRSPEARGRLEAFESWHRILGARRLSEIAAAPAEDMDAVGGLAP